MELVDSDRGGKPDGYDIGDGNREKDDEGDDLEMFLTEEEMEEYNNPGSSFDPFTYNFRRCKSFKLSSTRSVESPAKVITSTVITLAATAPPTAQTAAADNKGKDGNHAHVAVITSLDTSNCTPDHNQIGSSRNTGEKEEERENEGYQQKISSCLAISDCLGFNEDATRREAADKDKHVKHDGAKNGKL